jgi:hypothetical protein
VFSPWQGDIITTIRYPLLVPRVGVEPTTFSFSEKHSTDELPRPNPPAILEIGSSLAESRHNFCSQNKFWIKIVWTQRDSNPRTSCVPRKRSKPAELWALIYLYKLFLESSLIPYIYHLKNNLFYTLLYNPYFWLAFLLS